MQARVQYAEYLRKAYQEARKRDGRISPWPPGSLTAPQGWVAKAVDQWREQHDVLRYRRKRRARREKSPIRHMIEMYEAATGACCCCD
jgi:hypothetical protein